jgi:hypothetical protein
MARNWRPRKLHQDSGFINLSQLVYHYSNHHVVSITTASSPTLSHSCMHS